MRINLPSAILLSGTVMLLSAAGTFAQSNDTATPAAPAALAKNSSAAQPAATQSPSSAESTKTEVKADSAAKPGATTAAAAEAPKHGATFTFGEDNEKDIVVDAPEAIEKARGLHNKAMDQFKAGDADGAVATEQSAAEAAPHYWLPHAGLVYIIMTSHKKPTDAIAEASKSLYGKHATVAERNTAKLFQQVHWLPPAVKALEKAVRVEPDNWKNRLALADALSASQQPAQAKEQLDAIKPDSIDQFGPLENIATHYMALDDFDKAKPLLDKALGLAKTDKEKQAIQDRQFLIALKQSDKTSLKLLVDKVSDELKKERPDSLLEARLLLADNPATADEIFNMAANVQSKYGDKTFFSIGREMLKRAEAASGDDRKVWLRKADSAFKNAASRNQTETNYRIADVAVLDMLGDQDGLTKALTDLKESLPVNSDSLKLADLTPAEANRRLLDFQRYNLVRAFELKNTNSGTPTGPVYKTSARELQYRVLKTACACHARSMRKALGQEPGVMFTSQSPDEKPVVTIVYDPRYNSAKKLMAAKIFETIKDPIEQIADKPLETLPQLNVLVMDTADSKLPIQVKRNVAYEMPFDTTGQVAANSDTNVH